MTMMAASHKSIPGLRNIGNTCYAAAVLQALASCSSLVRQLQRAASRLPDLQPAGGTFTSALLECLEQLQPSGDAAAPASVSPARVLHALRQHIGDAVLPAGEEHDAVEAFEVILGVVELELQRAFARSAKLQLESQGSLAALLRPPVLPTPPSLPASSQLAQQPGAGADGAGLVGDAEQEADGHAGGAASANRSMCSSSSLLVTTQAAPSSHSLEGASMGAAGPTGSNPMPNLPCSSEPQTDGAHAACNGSCMVASFGPDTMGQCVSAEAGPSPRAERHQQPGGSTQPRESRDRSEDVVQLQQQQGQPGSPEQPEDSRGSAAEQQQEQQPGSPKLPADDTSGSGPVHDAAARTADGPGDQEGGGGASFMYVDQVLSSWQAWARLSCQGSLASELQCLCCKHRFASQVTPFLSLPLTIPLAPGAARLGSVSAAAGASVQQCLRDFFGYEVVSGVTCTRCSLQATLAAAAEAGSLSPRLDGMRQALEERAAIVESEGYQQAVQSAGLEWVARSGAVVKRQVLARLPGVLCLQLRRLVWTADGEVKVAGRVRFPLLLRPEELGLPVLGHSVAVDHSSSLLGGVPVLPPKPSSEHQGAPVYGLRAVVVHYGGTTGRGGHYIIFRCLSTQQQLWARVSDEQVLLGIPAEEVQMADAAVLLYEKQPAGGEG